MPSAFRLLLFLLALLAASLPSQGDELLGPEQYLKILTDSKLRYNIITTPSKTPADEMRCPRRDETLRLESKGAEKSLVPWTIRPEAKKLIEEGEVLFTAKDFDGAGKKYQAAIEADPQAVDAYFFYGDTLLFGAKDAEGALEQYRKGLALDLTLPTGHLFASTALVHLGRNDEAREEIIKALTYHPAYDVIWSIAAKQPERWNAGPVVRHKFEPPAGFLGKPGKNGIDIYSGPELAWLGYAMCKAVWANEKQFQDRHQAKGGWSTEEERACVLNQLMSSMNKAQTQLEEEQKKKGVEKPEVKDEEVIAALPPLEHHIYDVAHDHLLDGYIIFEIIGQRCPLGMSMMAEESRQQVDAYIRKYVIVPAR